MDFQSAVRTCLRKYATFRGRAGRSEFWWFALFGFGLHIAARILDRILFHGQMSVMGAGGGPAMSVAYSRPVLDGLVSLLLFVPSLAVGARRMHDIGRSGWWQAIVLAGVVAMVVPFLGMLVLLGCVGLLIYWFAQPSEGPNAYGPGPEPAAG